MSETAEHPGKRADRRERILMAIQGVIVLCAAFSLIWWVTGHYVFVPGWITIAGLEAYAVIVTMRTIRLMRRNIREVQQILAEARRPPVGR